jgi:hypothetical protein
MSNDARAVFETYKPTTLTFDCYGTLIDWESGACRALRDICGFSQREVTDDALIDLFLQSDPTRMADGYEQPINWARIVVLVAVALPVVSFLLEKRSGPSRRTPLKIGERVRLNMNSGSSVV